MRRELLDYLWCINCGEGGFVISTETMVENEHVMEGQLKCDNCGKVFSISGGVPRFITSDCVSKKDLSVGEAYGTFFRKSDSIFGKGKLYGYTIEEEVPDFYQKTGLKCEFLKDKVFLDAGCGIGRLTNELSDECKTMIGVDITPAVDDAFQVTRIQSNVHIVQADLLNIPLKKCVFDIVWCDGALPYVSDFAKGLLSLIGMRKEKGFLFTWCYKDRKASILGPERIGQKAHWIPISIRFNMLLLIVFVTRLLLSVKNQQNFMRGFRSIATMAFDFSLAENVNHVSFSEVESILRKSGVKEVNILETQSITNITIG